MGFPRKEYKNGWHSLHQVVFQTGMEPTSPASAGRFFTIEPLGKPLTHLLHVCFPLRRRQWHPTPVLLPEGSHGRRSLVGCSPWDRWGSDTTARLSDFTFTFPFHALEKAMATHSSVLSWRIPGMGEPGGLPSLGSHRVRHNWCDLAVVAVLMYLNLKYIWEFILFWF